MRHLMLFLFTVGCAGPTQRYADTPTGLTKYHPTLAPPASGSDTERYAGVKQFENMGASQNAYREANRPSAPPGPPPPGGSLPPPAPVGPAPAEQSIVPVEPPG